MDSGKKLLPKINEQTIEETTKCCKKFECFKTENHLCQRNVINFVGSEVHFVNCIECCSYKISFGITPFCSCPTRKAIFNEYGK